MQTGQMIMYYHDYREYYSPLDNLYQYEIIHQSVFNLFKSRLNFRLTGDRGMALNYRQYSVSRMR